MNLEEFNDTAIIKKLKKSKSNEKLNELPEKVENDNKLEEPIQKNNRGRKTKYATDEERINARKIQQREYRERKKKDYQYMLNRISELEALVGH
ncbi:hypothetical protein [Paramuribaculum intestinale]|mgnify:FL=1|uniref:hypothetical protein n=1 Tax=Paramuribaculum intestinale TaxID=2094151 RepID=UPI00272AD784|nr:hypothetical protein [Paramuribaculum intestinale]